MVKFALLMYVSESWLSVSSFDYRKLELESRRRTGRLELHGRCWRTGFPPRVPRGVRCVPHGIPELLIDPRWATSRFRPRLGRSGGSRPPRIDPDSGSIYIYIYI